MEVNLGQKLQIGIVMSTMLAFASLVGFGCGSQRAAEPAVDVNSFDDPTFNQAVRLFFLRRELIGVTKDELLKAVPDARLHGGFASALPERGQESDLKAREHFTPRHTFRNAKYEFRINAFDRVMDIGLVLSDATNQVAEYLTDDYAGKLALRKCVLKVDGKILGRLEWFSNLQVSSCGFCGLIVERDAEGRVLLVSYE